MSWNPFHRCANLWCFLVFFCLCYFLETITFTYLVSAVQSIERQFQIPSRMSGSLVSATDIGYVITVVILAYYGSRSENRARWIGAGCLLIAIACFIVALPTFVFPSRLAVFNTKELTKDILEPLTEEEIRTPHAFLKTMWGRRLPPALQSKLNATGNAMNNIHPSAAAVRAVRSLPCDHLDDTLFGKQRWKRETIEGDGDKDVMINLRANVKYAVESYYFGFDNYSVFAAKMYNITNEPEILEIPLKLVQAAGLPFGFCRNESMLVKSRMKEEKCKQQDGDTGNSGAFAIVFIGITLIGVGHSMPWTLGMPMIDDNVNKQKTPYYFAGVFFVRIMGPVVGFMLGALCSKLYVDLKDPPAGISPLDPRWIGAWWLGFLVIFVALTIPSLLLMCFPKFNTKESTKKSSVAVSYAAKSRTPVEIKNGEKALIQENTVNENSDGSNIPERQTSVIKEIKGFGRSLIQILRCPVYTGSLIGRLFDAFAFKGYFTFKPKYLENHYGITQFKSSILMGVQGVVGYAGGVVLGSLLMRKARLEGRKAAFYVGACSLITAILSFVQIFLGCHSVVNQIGRFGIENGNETHPVWPSCPGCNCESSGLYPVCSRNGTPYYSPCHAGCSNFTLEKVGMEANFHFNQCSGIDNDIDQASREWCQDDCNTPFIIYFVLGCIGGIIAGSAVIPGVLIVMRSVANDYRSVALGFSGFIVSLISTFPSPPVFGLIIDTACVVWNTGCGGTSGSCQIYDPTKFRQRIYIFHGALRFTALLFDIWVWYFAKDLKLMEDEMKTEEAEEPEQPIALGLTPSFAREIEVEVKGIQATEGGDVLDRKMSI